MLSLHRSLSLAGALIAALAVTAVPIVVAAQERLPWNSGSGARDQGRDYDDRQPQQGWPQSGPQSQDDRGGRQGDVYRPSDSYRQGDTYRQPDTFRQNDAYRPADPYRQSDAYRPGGRTDDGYRPPAAQGGYIDNYRSGRGYVGNEPPASEDPRGSPGYGQPYSAPRETDAEPYDRGSDRRADGPPAGNDGTFSQSEITSAGHRFFGSISKGLASVIEYAFQQSGRPNGYILGEDAGGAFVAGLRYGEGVLYTKDARTHRVYWQGPSLGYDFGAEGSKTIVLVYNLRDPSEIYNRFGGVQGSAYIVGGVSIQFQKNDDVTLAPIRAGLGLRLGANVGYLKYTRSPTWNPF